MRSIVGKIFNNAFSREVIALYIIYALNSLIPLVTTPYLARVLGPTSFGLLAFFQSFAIILTVLIDFGFNYSATRTLARSRGDVRVRALAIREVFGAKLILVAVTICFSASAMAFVPIFRSNPRFLFPALSWGCIQGLNLVWYFQGVGKIARQSIIDTIARAAATAAVYLLVRSPDQAALPLVFNSVFALAGLIVGLVIISKDTPLAWPSFSYGLKSLSVSWPLFIYRATTSICTLGSGIILGFFNTSATVGYYTGAERLVRGLATVSQPISQVLYSQLNHKLSAGVESARLLFIRGFVLTMSLTSVMCLFIFVFAHTIVHFALGDRFLASVQVLRILCFVIPLSSLTMLFGVQWMVPLGLERTFTKITVGTAMLNLITGIAVASRFAQVGVSWAVVSSEIAGAIICFVVLGRKELSPFKPAVVNIYSLQTTLTKSVAVTPAD